MGTISVAIAAACPAVAQDDDGPHPEIQSVVSIAVIADRGLACETLAPWEAAIVRDQVEDLLDRFSPEHRIILEDEATRLAASVSCGNQVLSAWPETQQERWWNEELPKRLAAYRALAVMASPPEVFDAATGRDDYGRAIRSIDSLVVTLTLEGAPPLGQGSWWDYIDLMQDVVQQRAAAPSAEDNAYFEDVARFTELWLASVLAE